MKPLTSLRLWLAVLACWLTAAGTLHAQTVIYVDADATGPTKDGATWCSAFTELHAALGVAGPNSAIRVANGTYLPSTIGLTNTREATFSLVDGVAIEGGYAGCGAVNPDARDVALNETVLSGDLNGDDGDVSLLDDFAACYSGASGLAAGCVGFDQNVDNAIDGTDFAILLLALRYSENCYHVVSSTGNGATASLDGCTISGGNATGSSTYANGGGMYVVVGNPTVSSCVWTANVATNGGGVYNDLNSQALFQDCTFRSNHAYTGTNGGLGGGALNFNGQPTFLRCAFQSNGSGSGGGMFSQNSSATIRDARFLANRAGFGGGLYTSAGSTDIGNAVFSGNAALIEGGGMRVVGGSPNITGSVFTLNDGAFGGGGIASLSADVTVVNSILWNNSAGAGTTESAQFDASFGTISVTFSCLQGLSVYAGGNNIASDPMFVNATGIDGLPGTSDDDVHLVAASPCVDTGNNVAVGASTDLDGNARIQDGDSDGTAIVDMGAFELTFVPPPVCYSVRDLSVPRLSYEPGVAKTVHIELAPGVGTLALGVEDSPPAGWTVVTNISNSGSYDVAAHKVKWGPLLGPPFPVELTYDITPPVDAVGEVCFDGVSSADGAGNEVTCGDLCVDALPCPFLPADELQPACAAGCADCTCGTCGDGRVELCEMIGYACSWKSGCNDDIAAMTRAAFLWQSGEFLCWSQAQANWVSLAALPVNPGCCEVMSLTGGAVANADDVSSARRLQTTNVTRTNRAVVHTLGIRNEGRARTLNMPITIYTNDETVAVGLEMEVPVGWEVTGISDEGHWDDINRKVKWGPFFQDLSRVVRFRARALRRKVSLSGFQGTVSFDGFNEPIIFAPHRRK